MLVKNYNKATTVVENYDRYHDVSKQSRNEVNIGWCIPASCTPTEAEKYLNEYFYRLDYPLREENITYTAQIPQILCTSSNHQRSLDASDIAFCILTLILILLVIVATCWDYNMDFEKAEKGSLLSRFLLAFSARRNFCDLSTPQSEDNSLSILYGIKTCSIVVIIIGHRFLFLVKGPVSNFDYVEEMYRNVFVSFIFRVDFFVDTFFVISGLLVTYNLLCILERKYVNPAFIIFLRYMRLTPAYLFVIFFHSTMYYHTGKGPLWEAVIETEGMDCRKYWWTNILYISNYVGPEHMCLVHTWYLMCDFHFFIIGVGLVFLMIRKRKYGLWTVLIFTVVSIIIPFVTILAERRHAFLRIYTDFLASLKVHPDFIFYRKSHLRATPYFIGMFSGYTYYKLRGSGKILSKVFLALGDIFLAFMISLCLYLLIEAPVRRIMKEIFLPNKTEKIRGNNGLDPQAPKEDSRL